MSASNSPTSTSPVRSFRSALCLVRELSAHTEHYHLAKAYQCFQKAKKDRQNVFLVVCGLYNILAFLNLPVHPPRGDSGELFLWAPMSWLSISVATEGAEIQTRRFIHTPARPYDVVDSSKDRHDLAAVFMGAWHGVRAGQDIPSFGSRSGRTVTVVEIVGDRSEADDSNLQVVITNYDDQYTAGHACPYGCRHTAVAVGAGQSFDQPEIDWGILSQTLAQMRPANRQVVDEAAANARLLG